MPPDVEDREKYTGGLAPRAAASRSGFSYRNAARALSSISHNATAPSMTRGPTRFAVEASSRYKRPARTARTVCRSRQRASASATDARTSYLII
jgi:hypothetical protein